MAPEFVRVAGVGDLPPGGMKDVMAGDKPILIANVGGKVYAVAGRCSHRQGVLANGTLEANIVTCPRHGSKFDVTTGKNVGGPKVMGVRGTTGDIQAFEVKVEGSDIMVRV